MATALWGKSEYLKWLPEAGADINVTSTRGATALHLSGRGVIGALKLSNTL
ncbi:hypothetical protein [Salinisphaera sp. G21_0]|uniref:hypothetical protein n=1 Tax=Salinisphaera sp. G21_0 TaxID=2821094 RepID=UPI001ADCC6FD|nr:hypothetical protein [Salinisphaera sp. G21_0]